MTPEQDQLVLEHLSLVHKLARKCAKSLPIHLEIDDLVSNGTIGLIEAAERFDPAINDVFPVYASIRIKGAILNGLRSSEYGNQALRSRQRMVHKTECALASKLGRKPEEEEIATAAGMSVADYRKLLCEIETHTVDSLESEEGETREVEDKSWRSQLDYCLATSQYRHLQQAIAQLPERMQKVLTMYYCDELSYGEISSLLKVTRARVSQLHNQSLNCLKLILEKGKPLSSEEVRAVSMRAEGRSGRSRGRCAFLKKREKERLAA